MLSEIELDLLPPPAGGNLLEWLSQKTREKLPGDVSPVRLVVTASDSGGYRCEVTTFNGGIDANRIPKNSILEFRHRQVENTGSFNAVLLVPTGIGADIGGHAGDATPVAQLLASVCDTLVTHPNVVNASDINEIPGNGLYVEGSVICRLLMGTAGLQPVRSNRVLVLMNSHTDRLFHTLTVNSVNAARASYGLICPRVIELEPPLIMISEYTPSSRAAGRVEDLGHVLELLDRHRNEYDAVAISSVITVPTNYHGDYFNSGGSMVNPWGGVESMLTHTISSIYDVPSAHSPMLESQEVLDADTGIVDPRMAAEDHLLAVHPQGPAKKPQNRHRSRSSPKPRRVHRQRRFLLGNSRRMPGPAHPGGVGAGDPSHRRAGKQELDEKRPDPTPLAAGATARSGKLLGGRRGHGRVKSGNRPQLRPAPHQPSHRGKIRRRVGENAGHQRQWHRRIRNPRPPTQGSSVAASGLANKLEAELPLLS